MRRIVLSFWILILGVSLQAQTWEVGGLAGTTFYFGDLNTNFSFQRPGFSIGGLARYNLDSRLSLRASANFARVGYADTDSGNPFQRVRNLSFNTNIIEGNLVLEFNFLPYHYDQTDNFFTPYLFAGVTVFSFNPTTELNGRIYFLNEMGTEGQAKGNEYFLTQPAIAYGGGFKFDISYDWSFNINIGARYLFTDYFDDVSGVYADRSEIESARGEVAALLADRSWEVNSDGTLIGEAGRQRGDTKTRDMYMVAQIGLVYNFARVACPSFRR